MQSITRIALRAPVTRAVRPAFTGMSLYLNNADPLAVRFASGGAHAHESESFEAFNTRYRNFFDSCNDVFELQRGLNNCFAYDLVPTTEVVDSALRCARKVNDYATEAGILEVVREKVENKGQYKAYLEELKGTIEELGTLPLPTALIV